MKKITFLILAIIMLLTLASCSDSSSNNSTTPNNQSSNNVQTDNPSTNELEDDVPGENAKPMVLVAYFSATSNTASIAADIAESTGADLYAIEPAEPYTAADLDYGNANSRTSIEMNDPDFRAAIGSASLENMADYDVVFIGYPIWWGQAPRIIATFLETYDFNGKIIVPFCTSGSSGIGSSATNLQGLTSGATWLDGQRFSSNASHESIIEWLNSLEIDISVE